jgi:hypothetical protein
MALVLAQFLTEMSASNLLGGEARPPSVSQLSRISGNFDVSNLEVSPTCYRVALKMFV